MSAALPRVSDRLAADVEEGLFCTGAQAFVAVDGEVVLDEAWGVDGLGRPFAVDTLSAVYCAIKPVTAMVVGHLVAIGELSFADRLGDLVGVAPALADVTVEQLLEHTAGVHVLRSTVAASVTPTMRSQLAVGTPPAVPWNAAVDAGYSEWAAWYLLKAVVEGLTGRTLRSWIDALVVDPLDLAGEVGLGMTVDQHAQIGSRLGVNVDLRGLRPVPLLMERVASFACDDDPSLSGFASMRGLGTVYGEVLRCVAGEPTRLALDPGAVRTLVTHRRSRRHDVVLDAPCSWALGFMAGLGDLGFGPLVGGRAVGHCGQVGTSTAFCDPDRGLVAAVLVNGLIDHHTGMTLRRPALVGDLYRDLADLGVP